MLALKDLSPDRAVLSPCQTPCQTPRLSLESTLQALSLFDFQIESVRPGSKVAQAFKDNPLLPGVILTKQGQFSGMISRRCFLEHMLRQDGQELFLRLPIKFLDLLEQADVLKLPKDTLIVQASQQALQRAAPLVYEPIVVEIEPQVYRLLDVHHLLVAQSSIYELTAAHCVALDIQHEQTEAELRKALEKEKELSEVRNRFVSMASHDFRTPLATILTSSDLLKVFGHQFSHEKKIQYLNKIQAQVKNMTQLLDDILFIGKANSGRMEFNPVTLNIEAFCQEILEEIAQIDGKKHVFAFECRRECFEGKCSRFKVDRKLLRQILTNLLSNAVKYSPQGGSVYFDLIWKNEEAVFKIRDEGIGIPIADRKHLFEGFHRASNVGNIAGTGLGMAIIKQGVELHGGSISFESEVGVGTTFTVCIPTSQTQEPPP